MYNIPLCFTKVFAQVDRSDRIRCVPGCAERFPIGRRVIVQLNYHIKASVNLMTFDNVRENQIIPWQGVYFFTNTVLQNYQNIYTVVMKHW